MSRRSIVILAALAVMIAAAAFAANWLFRTHPDEPETAIPVSEANTTASAPAPQTTSTTQTPLPPLAGQTFVAGCRQGECGWMEVLRFERVMTVPQGELRRLVIRRGSSLHPDGNLPDTPADAEIDWALGEKTDYVFCSTVRPAFAFEDDDGGLVTHYLDPFNLGGYQYTSAGVLMRACHRRDDMPDAAGWRALGYRPGTRNEQVEGVRPEDLTRF